MSYNTPPSSGNSHMPFNTSMSNPNNTYGTHQTSGTYTRSQMNNVTNRIQGHKPTTSIDLAQQYETDMKNIRRSVFKDLDKQGRLIESYVSHVRIIEDSKSPSSRPPANSPQTNKKDRFLLLSVKSSGRMRLHKAKESSSGIIQIGRSWDFDELTTLELDNEIPTGILCQMGKNYYWEVHTPKERRVWCTTLIENYIKYTNGKLPQLVNCSVEYFHLEGLKQMYDNKGKNLNQPIISQPFNNKTDMSPRSPVMSQTKSFPNQLRSPTKSNSPDVTSLKRELGTPPLNNAAAFSARSATAAALIGASAAAGVVTATEEAKNLAEQQKEKAKQEEIDFRRKQELEKRKQQELERRRIAEQEQEQERLKYEAEMQFKLEEEERQKQSQKIGDDEPHEFSYKPPHPGVAKRGPLSQALSEAPSQISFEYGDDSRYQHINQSVESHVSDFSDLNNYIDGYASAGDEETAPLSLSLPKARQNLTQQDYQHSPMRLPVITNTIDEDDNKNIIYATEKEINKLITSPHQLNILEDKLDASIDRKLSRSRAFSRVNHEDEINDTDVLEILEEIGYDPVTDNSEVLEKKLLRELDLLQYDKIQTLTEIDSIKLTIRDSIQTAFQTCNNIDPILSLFGVELSTFKEDVEFIEVQGKGLHVETTNEKLLMNELNDIVHSVEISDLKLNKLMKSDIDLSVGNSEFENILLELYNALLKINEENNDESTTEYKLSKMKALQEKKRIFEGAKDKFIHNFKEKSKKLFGSVSMSLSSKLAQVNSDNFESEFLKTIYIEKITNLLTLGGMISFIKNVSYQDYEEILDNFVNAFQPVFENVTSVLLKDLTVEVSKNEAHAFHFTSNPTEIIDESYVSSKAKSKSEFNSGRNHNLFSIKNEVAKSDGTESSENNRVIKLIEMYCSQLINVVGIQQELLKQMFGLSSKDSKFTQLVTTELSVRCDNFKNNQNFLDSPIESDRVIGDHVFNIMKLLFDPVFAASLRILISVSKNRMLEMPAILSILKSCTETLAPTCHEYTYSNFTKFETKITSVWTKTMDKMLQEVSTSTLKCHVSNFIKSYPVFFFKIQSIIDSLDNNKLGTFGSNQQIYGNYYMVWTVIQSSLIRNVETLKIETLPHAPDSPLQDVDVETRVSIQKHLTLWVNYRWALDESRNLSEFPKDLLKSIDDLRERELNLFTSSFIRQFNVGHIMRLVEDMESLIKNNGNPSNFSTYSIENIKSLMIPFKGDNLKREILNIATELKSILNGRCHENSGSSVENEYSLQLGASMEKLLYNNGMNTMCQSFISTFSRLSEIVDTYYSNFDIPVDKYIINFNFKKHYNV